MKVQSTPIFWILTTTCAAFIVDAGCANDRLLTPDGAGERSANDGDGTSADASADGARLPRDSSDATTGASSQPTAGIDAGATDAAVTCATAAPPSAGLALWLQAGKGYHADGNGSVTSWDDQSGHAAATAPSDAQRPTLVANGLNGKTTLHFEGAPDDADQQALERSVPINGLEEMTVVFVNATPILWKDDPTEWCHYAGCNASANKVPGIRAVSETGCSGTYQHVLWWNGAPDPANPGSALDWSGVYLSPKQEGIGFRFGNGNKTYSDDCCDIVHDENVEWPRPSSIGASWTRTVAVHDHTTNRIFVDGAKVHELTVPGGSDPKVYADDVLDVGNGFGWVDGHNHGGDVAEVMVYTRALPDADLQAVEAYLQCSLFPEKL